MVITSLDPFEREIHWQRLQSIADECWTTAHRTAFSPIITDALDLAVEILDHRGRAVAHAKRSIPSFTIALPALAKEVLRRYTHRQISDGDVFITNDPWLCAGHLPDPGLIMPIFRRTRLIGFVGVIGHVSDIGGVLRRSEAQDLYEEGLQIPLCRYQRRGKPNDTLQELIRANVRSPHTVVGDIEAQITAANQGIERVNEYLDEYHFEDLVLISQALQTSSEEAMRRAVDALPNGVYRSQTRLDSLAGSPLEIEATLTVRDDSMLVEFPVCPPQISGGGVNSTLSYTTSHSLYVLHCILGPTIAANDGCYRPFEVTAPEGTILNCRRPASVGLRMLTGWHIHPLIHSALAEVLPERVRAPSGTMSWIEVFGRYHDGRGFHDHFIVGAGQGAGMSVDGVSGTSYPSSAANIPVEVFEHRVPVLIEQKALIPGSGGSGEHRGGLGQRVVLSPRVDAAELSISMSLDHRQVPPMGLFGGGAGRLARLAVVDGGEEEAIETGHTTVKPPSALAVEVAGGGGFGEPAHRQSTAVASDRAEGLLEDGV